MSSEASFPAARVMVACKRMEELGKISKCVPPLDEITGPNFQKQLSCYLVSACTALELQEQLQPLPGHQFGERHADRPPRQTNTAAEATSTNTVEENQPETVGWARCGSRPVRWITWWKGLANC